METSKNTVELAVVIVDFGSGSKVLKIAKQHDVQHSMVIVGRGTLNNRFLEFLRLADIRKEIVMMASDETSIAAALNAIDERFNLNKPFHGIAFTMLLNSLVGHGVINTNDCNQLERGNNMYRSLIIIVDREKTEQVMETARKAGARGGTIWKARGAAEAYNSGSLFGIDIEPQKEVLLILAETALSETIANAIRETHDIGTEGNGVIICQNVHNVYGIK